MGKNHYTKSELEEYEKNEKTCKHCGTKFTKTWSKWILSEFCCKRCAKCYSSILKRQEVNRKVSEKLKGRRVGYAAFFYDEEKEQKLINEYSKNPKTCPICGKIIPYEKRKNKTCSIECGSVLGGLNNRGNPSGKKGGHRDKGGRSKSGYYKGHFCGSTYELVYTIYNIDHNIPFERNKKGFPYEYNGMIRNYYPDYITPNGYVEIKGYWTKLVDIKANALSEPIQILYEKDLQYAFDYVSKTYMNGKKSEWQVLYDDHKPMYSKVCPQCGITFHREQNDRTFCSHKCGALYRHKNKK